MESDWLAMLFKGDMLWMQNISLQLQGIASQSIGNVNHPCSAVWVYPVMDTHTSSDRKLNYAGQSQYELRQEHSFLLFSKAFIAL